MELLVPYYTDYIYSIGATVANSGADVILEIGGRVADQESTVQARRRA